MGTLHRFGNFVDSKKSVIAALVGLQAIVYSFFFTSLLFTNHTFPNALLYTYPSFKTLGEGRWFADILILLQGGSGVQPLQMFLAVIVQSFNACLLSELLGVRGKLRMILIGGALCLFPAFADYYSFTIDHLTFVLGDTFVIIGTFIFVKLTKPSARIFGTAFFFVVAVASYQPKICLISLMAICGIFMRWIDSPKDKLRALQTFIEMCAVLFITIGIYWITTILTIRYDIGERAYINSVHEAMRAAENAYKIFTPALSLGLGGLPRQISFLPLLGVLVGSSALLIVLYRKRACLALSGLLLLFLLPIALSASHIVNLHTWNNAGRVTSAFAYCFVFFCAFGLNFQVAKWICGGVLVVTTYFFAVLATQISNAAAFKTLYDVNAINRIATRLENLTSSTSVPVPLVVAGHYPKFNSSKFVKFPTTSHGSHVFSDAFAPYRQIQILNFFMGVKAFCSPSSDERARALKGMAGRPSWPEEGSAYVDQGIVVILLEKPRNGIPLTWCQ